MTSRCQGLFPPHPFFEGKALRTRLDDDADVMVMLLMMMMMMIMTMMMLMMMMVGRVLRCYLATTWYRNA